MKKLKIILNGIINENPTFVLFLGMCPVLATSSSIYSAIGMSACVFLVLLMSNISISLIAKFTPSEIRIPVYIVIIATIVTAVSLFVNAYAPGIYTTLGSYLQLIVVNCIILGRAESYASKNSVVNSIMDAIGISLGFFFALTIVAALREILGTGVITMKDLEGNVTSITRIIPLAKEDKVVYDALITEFKIGDVNSLKELISEYSNNGYNLSKITKELKVITDETYGTKEVVDALKLAANQSFSSPYEIGLLAQPSGAFLVLGFCVAGFNGARKAIANKKAAKAAESK